MSLALVVLPSCAEEAPFKKSVSAADTKEAQNARLNADFVQGGKVVARTQSSFVMATAGENVLVEVDDENCLYREGALLRINDEVLVIGKRKPSGAIEAKHVRIPKLNLTLYAKAANEEQQHIQGSACAQTSRAAANSVLIDQ